MDGRAGCWISCREICNPCEPILELSEPQIMKARVFDVVLHKLPPGKSPASYLEEQLNEFFKQHSKIQLLATHMNTLILPPDRNAMRGSEAAEPTVIIFSTLFYNEES
jgi:hypothetical protein